MSKVRWAATLIVVTGIAAFAGCGELRPSRGTGAAAIPAGEGGGYGPVEGSPNNASDLGPGVVPH